MRILLVEDDLKAARLLVAGLQEENWQVDHCASAEQAEQQIPQGYDLLILDWNLPGMDGMLLCNKLRGAGVSTPVLMLTARDALQDKVQGLRQGADDYLVKPYAFEELLARIEALRRRAELQPAPVLQAFDLSLHLQTHTAVRAGQEIELTRKEFALLEFFIRQQGQLISRHQLAEHVWKADLIAIDNLIDVHIKNLRKKIDLPGCEPLIQTVRGQGFVFALPE